MRSKASDLLRYPSIGTSEAEILKDFTYIEKEDITACLAYAVKNN